jgi:hypothetical protein
MKFLFALTAILALGCSSSSKKATDDAANAAPAATEAPAVAEDAMPAAPADAGPAVSMDAMPAATDDEKPVVPAPAK